MKFPLLAVLTGLLLCAAMAPGHALNLRDLKYSPSAYFTDEDWRIFKDTAKEVLDNKKDKTTTSWSNPKSGASGKFSVLETLEREGAHCRKMGIFNSAGGVTSKSVFVFCKQPDGDWKVAP